MNTTDWSHFNTNVTVADARAAWLTVFNEAIEIESREDQLSNTARAQAVKEVATRESKVWMEYENACWNKFTRLRTSPDSASYCAEMTQKVQDTRQRRPETHRVAQTRAITSDQTFCNTHDEIGDSWPWRMGHQRYNDVCKICVRSTRMAQKTLNADSVPYVPLHARPVQPIAQMMRPRRPSIAAYDDDAKM